MLITTNLSVSGPLSLSSVASTTTSLSAMILESGLVKSRPLGSMSLKGDNEYLPQVGLSFPNIFNLNTSALNFANQSLTVSLANQTAKTFLAAPNGLSGTPSFRAIVASDIPTLNQNTTGNASTATSLQTARTLTIGNTGKTFDGTNDVSWSLAEIGAQSILTNPITGTGTANRIAKFTASGTIGDSQIFDNGTNVGIGAESTSGRFSIRAQGTLATDIVFRVGNSTDTQNFLVVNGAGDVYNRGAQGVATNTFFGENVGRNTTGNNNTAIGISALQSNTTGSHNTAIGISALQSNTTGSSNIANGNYALQSNTKGSHNTAIGISALQSNTTGGYNTAIGLDAGRSISDGSSQTVTNKSIFIGYNTRANANNQTNQIVIGDSAIGDGSNSVVLGNTSITRTRLQGQVIMGSFASAPTGIEGAIYYNSTDKKHYGFNGTTWEALSLKDVIEGYFNGTNFYTDSGFTNLITPESGKIYVTLDTNLQYRWSGSAYVKISDSAKQDKIEQITPVTLLTSGWSLVSGLYQYNYSNVNITTTTIVDVIPDNNTIEIVKTAEILPQTNSSNGSVTLFSKNLPTSNIVVTLNIIK